MAEQRACSCVVARTLLCLLCILTSVHAEAQSKDQDSEPEEKVYDMGPDVVPPRILKQVPPRQPNVRGVRVVGSVTVALVVSSKGAPRDVRVIKGLDKDVDQSAVEAVTQWRFAPAQKDGKPVAVRISLEITFHQM